MQKARLSIEQYENFRNLDKTKVYNKSTQKLLQTKKNTVSFLTFV